MAEPVYPIRFPDQLRQHLRALRKSRQMTQAQLGALLGVSQARIAEIEANPAAISVEQLMKIFSVLDATLLLQEKTTSFPADTGTENENQSPRDVADAPLESATAPSQKRRLILRRQPESAAPSPPENDTSSTPKRRLVLRPRKGAW